MGLLETGRRGVVIGVPDCPECLCQSGHFPSCSRYQGK